MRIHGTTFIVGKVGPFSIDTRRLADLLVDQLNAEPRKLAVKAGATLVAGYVAVAERVELATGDYGISITLELDDADLATATATTPELADLEATSAAADEAIQP